MKKLLALVVIALSSVTLHAQVVWIEENVDFFSGVRTGVIQVNGDTYTIGRDGPDAPPNFANLSGADLSGADLRDVDISGWTFTGTNLRDADLSGANLVGAEFDDADLSGADLSGANLRFADLRGADLSGANLTDANLRNANLGNANLSGANLTDASLRDANLSGANLADVTRADRVLDPRIAELEAQLAAVTAERDAAISERDARPTLEEVQDARVGSLVFRADEGANLLDLRFFIQSSENLQDWEITGECNFLLPMDTGKRFLRIALR